ncbi:glycosyltransferase family 4 protein [Flavilitoribacter nigricans]|uniref:Glycosyltransferase family 1 protein n=1 Tax=Flavilitoribacter nigricans (strain ATCC 23147 / DSM 23189 / NBRC 102662 / NCIMB 1420 / SS-2) TaxID=1122177 RepID=A0A2D0MYY4_FLAN2|nr:glycosyltransferase family 4 protein [Flavilitoribacter nigricans]PHN01484.1 glycosyltransferase family 1 protein [Flavilitoribacter nigricans DSM 23189 = NBRC 102662]
MSKKILFVASINKHILAFHLPYLEWFKKEGYDVHVAGKGDEVIPFCDQKFNVPFVRTPFSLGHFRAYFALKEIIENGQYEIIHCHTPMASVITRLAASNVRKKGTKVLYTSHGFHFFKGAPVINWLFYYPVEYMLSGKTDAIITINSEDYKLVKEKAFRNKETYRIYGIGVDRKRFVVTDPEKKQYLRIQNHLTKDDFVLIYVAEFIERKNHEFIINAAAKLQKRIPNLKILFAGRGALKSRMEALVEKLELEKKILFLGFRKDIQNVIGMADVGISASRQEGLGLNLIEEALIGLPLVATEDRGHREIITHNENGFLFPQNDEAAFIGHVFELWENSLMRIAMGETARKKAEKFLLENTLKDLSEIYSKYMAFPASFTTNNEDQVTL